MNKITNDSININISNIDSIDKTIEEKQKEIRRITKEVVELKLCSKGVMLNTHLSKECV